MSDRREAFRADDALVEQGVQRHHGLDGITAAAEIERRALGSGHRNSASTHDLVVFEPDPVHHQTVVARQARVRRDAHVYPVAAKRRDEGVVMQGSRVVTQRTARR
jgi:hypothetical protein